MRVLERYFKVKESGSSLRAEITGGMVTFMTMAYIIFVNPAILSQAVDGAPPGAGMDFGSVMAATCLASALASLLMGLLARYPIALAPGMGLNAFFSFEICGRMGVPWQIALGMVFISGVFFTLLTLGRVREMIVDAIPEGLKYSAAVGIGMFIAFIGLKEAGVVVDDPATFVRLGDLGARPTLLAILGFLMTAGLMARGIKGALLWGILVTGLVGIPLEVVSFKGGIVGLPSIKPTFLQLDLRQVFQLSFLVPILILLFFDMFDTIGTLVGISSQAGFLKQGRLPRGRRALLSDSLGTIGGSLLGTSTVTSYIESAAGVAEGARTGLANVVTALLFLAALFFAPLAQMFGGGCQVASGACLHPVTAPVLIIVGCLMMGNVKGINWNDSTEAIPAFLTIIVMPLTFSIAHGLAIGFISYPVLKLAAGKGREVSPLVYVLAAVFVLRYVFLP